MERSFLSREDFTSALDYNCALPGPCISMIGDTDDFRLDFKIKPELLFYKKDLFVGLESVDLKKLMNHLVKDSVVSLAMSKYFHNLDCDRLEQEVVAGFLVNELLRSIELGRMVLPLVDELEKKISGTEHLCAVLRSCIPSSMSASRVIASSLDGNFVTSTASSIDHERSSDILTYKDIPCLTEVLCKCSHKWEELGVALQLQEHELAECRKASSSVLSLHGILNIRLNLSSQAAGVGSAFTLKTLKNALGSDLVGMKSLAESLEEKFKEHKKQEKLISKNPRLQLLEKNRTVMEACDGKATILGLPRCDEAQSYQWKKEAESLHNDSNYFGVCDDVLLIKSVRQGMEGEYSCYTNDNRLVAKISLEVIFSQEKRRLLDKYVRLKEVPNTWPPVGASSFVELALIHNDRHHVSDNYDYSVRGDMDDILKRKKRVKYADIFSSIENGLLVLVEGRPGSGKTTLTHKITRDWARGPDILSQVHELFLVSLRILALKKVISLSGILNIIYNGKTSQLVAAKLEESDGEGACFVIDGLDEYKERDNPDNVIYQLINKEYLPKATIIVASRPVGTVNVRDRASKRVEVLGFSKDQITTYLEAYNFKHEIRSVSRLDAFLKDHVNVRHTCYLPVHAAMICYIYDDCDGEIPSSETKIYEYFTLLTIKRMLKVNNDSTKIKSLQMLKGSLQKSFGNVCKLAFDMTVSSKQAALESDIDSHLSDEVPNIHSLGLVTVDSTARLLDFEHLYSFLHLTFQEFLAAFYLATLVDFDQLTLIREHIGKSEMSVVWKFYCGLNEFRENDERIEHIMISYEENDLYRFQCALESQQKAVCDSAFKNGKTTIKGTVYVSNHNFLSADFNALSYNINTTSCLITELSLYRCTLSFESTQYFIKKLSQDKLSKIKSLIFRTRGGRDQFTILKHFLKNLNSLEILEVEDQNLDVQNINILADESLQLHELRVLKLLPPSLHLLKMLPCMFKDLKEVHYLKASESHKQIVAHLLTVFDGTIIPLGCFPFTVLCNLDIKLPNIAYFLRLSHVILVNCNIGDDFVTEFSKADISNCEILRLDFNRITCAGMEYFSKHCLPKLTNLSCLSMACNQIGDAGAIALAQDLHKCRKSLTELDLQGNDFRQTGAVVIACAIKNDFHASFKLNFGIIGIAAEYVATVLGHWSSANVEREKVFAWRYVSSEGVAKAVGCCRNLYFLDLSGQIFKFSMSVLVQNLKVCTELERIDFSSCSDMTHNDLREIVDSLFLCKLQTIKLSSCEIDKYGAVVLAKCFTPTDNMHDLEDWISHEDFKTENITVVRVHNWFQDLVTLNLANNNMGSLGAAALSCGFNYCHKLESLNLCSNEIEADGAKMLANGLKSCNSLQVLTMDNNPLGADGAAEVFSAIESCLDLKALSFSHTHLCYNNVKKNSFVASESLYCPIIISITPTEMLSNYTLNGITQLRSSIKNWRNFEKLNLSYNQIKYDGAVILAEGLSNAISLVHLDLERNHLCAEAMTVLVNSIETFPLKHLNLGFNMISNCSSILKIEFNNLEHLEHLSLSKNSINSSGIQALVNGLEGHQALQVLDLTESGINSEGVITLATKLKSFSKLTTLCLNMNNLGAEGIEGFVNALSDNSSMQNIQELQLGSNSILSKGALALGKGLKYCNNIIRLDLQNNSICPEGAVAIAEGLKDCKSLTHFNLQFNYIGPGAVAIAEVIKNCNRIEYLDLGCNRIDSEGAVAIAKALQFITNITLLNLHDNNICDDASFELAKGLQCCLKLQAFAVHKNPMNSHSIEQIVDSLDYCCELQVCFFDDLIKNSSYGRIKHYNRRKGDIWEKWKEHFERI